MLRGPSSPTPRSQPRLGRDQRLAISSGVIRARFATVTSTTLRGTVGAFDPFLAAFPIRDGGLTDESWGAGPIEGFEELMSTSGGSSFERGLYRLHTRESSENAVAAVGEAFPELVGGIAAFGFDWLGRQFAIDLRRGRNRNVLLMEPGTGEILEIPLSFADFHNFELVDEPDAALAKSFFAEWAAANPTLLPLAPDVCVGYEIPLFLGKARRGREPRSRRYVGLLVDLRTTSHGDAWTGSRNVDLLCRHRVSIGEHFGDDNVPCSATQPQLTP